MGRSRSRSRSRERDKDEERKRSRPSDDFSSARDFDRQESRRTFTCVLRLFRLHFVLCVRLQAVRAAAAAVRVAAATSGGGGVCVRVHARMRARTHTAFYGADEMARLFISVPYITGR